MITVPLISVIMSCYNDERYVRQAIESILNQTFSDFEFIIIDDCSTDNTLKIIERYVAIDDRIILIKNEINLGLAASLNKGAAIARAAWLARMDGDDISEPNRFEVQYAHIADDVAVIGSYIHIIDEHSIITESFKVPTEHNAILKKLLSFGTSIIHPSVLINKQKFLLVNGYNPIYRTAQDYDLWLRISKVGLIKNIPTNLLRLRKHDNNISATKFNEQLENTFIGFYSYKKNINSLSKDDYIFLKCELKKLFTKYNFEKTRLNLHKFYLSSKNPYIFKRVLFFLNYFLFTVKKYLILNRLKFNNPTL